MNFKQLHQQVVWFGIGERRYSLRYLLDVTIFRIQAITYGNEE